MSIQPVYDNGGRLISRYDRLASIDPQPDRRIHHGPAIRFDTESLGGRTCTGDLGHGIQMALLLEPYMQFEGAYTMKHASREPLLSAGVEGLRYMEIELSYGGHTHHREIDLGDMEEPFTKLYLAKEIATGYAGLFDVSPLSLLRHLTKPRRVLTFLATRLSSQTSSFTNSYCMSLHS